MLYPKKKQFNSQPHSNRTHQNQIKYSEIQRLSLISKLSKALKLKYMPLFLSSNYDDKDLYSDINAILTQEILSKPTNALFAFVEKSIMSRISPKMESSRNNKPLIKGDVVNKNITDEAKAILPKEDIPIPEIKDDSQGQVQIYHTLANERHDLVDKLRLKMEMNSDHNDYCDTEPSALLKQLKEKKLKQQEEMSLYLQMQIDEKEQRENQVKLDRKTFADDQLNQIAQCKTEKDVVKENKLKMRKDFRVSLEKIVKERKDLEKRAKDQRKEIESNILSDNRLSLDKDKDKKIEKKKSKQELYNEMLIERTKYVEEKKQKQNDKLKLDRHYLREFDEVMKKREKESEEVYSKIRNKVKEQQELGKKLFPIHSSQTHPSEKKECYLKENEEIIRKADEEKRKQELRKNDMIEEMKKSLDAIIKVKRKEKIEGKVLDMKYKEKLVNDYNIYLNEQEKKKEKKREQLKKYKSELDTQIVERKKTELELLRNPFSYHSINSKEE